LLNKNRTKYDNQNIDRVEVIKSKKLEEMNVDKSKIEEDEIMKQSDVYDYGQKT
jgi:hypothetical protein